MKAHRTAGLKPDMIQLATTRAVFLVGKERFKKSVPRRSFFETFLRPCLNKCKQLQLLKANLFWLVWWKLHISVTEKHKSGCKQEDRYGTRVTQEYSSSTSQASNHVSVRITTTYYNDLIQAWHVWWHGFFMFLLKGAKSVSPKRSRESIISHQISLS